MAASRPRFKVIMARQGGPGKLGPRAGPHPQQKPFCFGTKVEPPIQNVNIYDFLSISNLFLPFIKIFH